jgi:hypothetical protein
MHLGPRVVFAFGCSSCYSWLSSIVAVAYLPPTFSRNLPSALILEKPIMFYINKSNKREITVIEREGKG